MPSLMPLIVPPMSLISPKLPEISMAAPAAFVLVTVPSVMRSVPRLRMVLSASEVMVPPLISTRPQLFWMQLAPSDTKVPSVVLPLLMVRFAELLTKQLFVPVVLKSPPLTSTVPVLLRITGSAEIAVTSFNVMWPPLKIQKTALSSAGFLSCIYVPPLIITLPEPEAVRQ